MTPDLGNKAAVVTGSTSGIGHAIAAALAAAGARVMLNGIESREEGAAVADRLAKVYACDIRYTRADLSEPAAAGRVVDEAQKAFGTVDILVNNAGIQHTDPIESFPPEKWDAILAVMLTSAFHTTRRVVPMMQERQWGRIINIASAHGRVASPNKAAYVSAKHGLVGLTRVVALENAAVGITTNAICPGWVETPLIRPQIEAIAERENISIDEAKTELVRHKQPSMRFVQPEQIGAMSVFLCSDAASQINGAALSIDGGWTAQ
jgi:3-hydroxybutyrate dehydrogenase